MKKVLRKQCFFQRCLPLLARDVAFGSDVHCVSEVSPCGEVGKHHITANEVRNITMRSVTSLWHSQNFTKFTSCIFVLRAHEKNTAKAVLQSVDKVSL